MSTARQPKLGVPALACVSDGQGHVPLSLRFQLRIQHNEASKQATLMLATVAAAFVEGADATHAFIAQYDADNLVHSASNLPALSNTAAAAVFQARLAELERDGNPPNVVALTLRLKQPCPLWCPRVDALVPAAGPATKASFDELVQLAKATTICIVLDRKWLAHNAWLVLQNIANGSGDYTGFPVARYYSQFFNAADWTVFRPETPRKRAASEPSTPPDYKRAKDDTLSSPTPILSPTEVATSPAYSAHLTPPTYADEVIAHTDQAIAHALQHRLPDLLQQQLPTLLPQLLPGLLALPTFPSYTSDVPTSPNVSTHPTPTHPLSLPPSLTPLGAALIPSLIEHFHPQLSHMISSSLNRGVSSNLALSVFEFNELADERVSELHIECSRALDDISGDRDAALEDIRDMQRDGVDALVLEKESVVEAVEEEVGEALDGLREAIGDVSEEALDDVGGRIERRIEEMVGAAELRIQALEMRAAILGVWGGEEGVSKTEIGGTGRIGNAGEGAQFRARKRGVSRSRRHGRKGGYCGLGCR